MNYSRNNSGGECDHLAHLPEEVRDSVLRLQVDPDDMYARVIFVYHFAPIVEREIRKAFGKNRDYADYPFLEEWAFFRAIRDLHRYDRTKGTLDQTIRRLVKWGLEDLRRILRGWLVEDGYQHPLPEKRDIFEKPANRTLLHYRGDNTFEVRPVTMFVEDVGSSLAQVSGWRDTYGKRAPDTAADFSPAVTSYVTPPVWNASGETTIWQAFLADFFRMMQKGKERGSDLAESGIFLLKGFYLDWLEYGQLHVLLVGAVRANGWHISATIDERYVHKRIWDLSKRMRAFYWENAHRYAFDNYDPFAHISTYRDELGMTNNYLEKSQ